MPPSRSRHQPFRGANGSVILLVLVTVLLAAFMLTKFVQRAGTELLADARAGDQARMRREAYSALEVTLAVLADFHAVDHGLFGPAQGWDRPLAYAGYEPGAGVVVDVAFEDESGRISLPRADAATLESLFVLTGVDRNQAERASDALLGWMHPDYVPPTLEADPGNYERAAIPHRPAHRPLRSLAELASVAVVRDLFFDDIGRPNERLREFAGAVSLLSFDRVNLNAAVPAALAAKGFTAGQIAALRDSLQVPGARHRYFRGIDEAAAALGATAPLDQFGTQVLVLRINLTVRDGARRYRLSAVVAPAGAAVAPPRAAPAPDAAPPAQKAPVSPKKLDYPFQVLELVEDAESGPTPPDDSEPHD